MLLFVHPLAGVQLVKGTVEPGESVCEAAVRELAEESGIEGSSCATDLGAWEQCLPGQVWHFRAMNLPSSALPERWCHQTQDDGGHQFEFFWHPLHGPDPENCHPVYAGALKYLRTQLPPGSAAASVA